MRSFALAAALALGTTACGGGDAEREEPAEPAATSAEAPAETPAAVELPEGADPAAQVSENYADCLAALGATSPVYTPGGTEGSQTVGEVVATAPGLILVWTVGVGNTGDVLTFPDDATTAALESVGC